MHRLLKITCLKLLICFMLFLNLSACVSRLSDQTVPAKPDLAKKDSQVEKAVEPTKIKKELKKEYLIGVSQRWGNVPFLRTITQGARDSAQEWGKKIGADINIITTDAGIDNPKQQVRDLEYLASRKVDGLLIFPGDSKIVVDPLIHIYNLNNIPVVITDIGVDGGDYLSLIITDNIKAGAIAGEVMAKAVQRGGKVAIIDTGPGNNNTQMRIQGFTNKAKELGLTLLPKYVTKISVEDGRTLMDDILSKNPDLDGVFETTSETAIGATQALESHNNSRCKLVTFDIDATILQKVKQESIVACIVQDPYFMGYEGANQLMYYLTGETSKIKKMVDSPVTVCTKENAYSFDNNPQVKLKH